jgi:hypothetical protein
VRGPALTVLERMGLLEAAEAKKTGMRGASFVDADGNELSRDTESTPTDDLIDNPDIEILLIWSTCFTAQHNRVPNIYSVTASPHWMIGEILLR